MHKLLLLLLISYSLVPTLHSQPVRVASIKSNITQHAAWVDDNQIVSRSNILVTLWDRNSTEVKRVYTVPQGEIGIVALPDGKSVIYDVTHDSSLRILDLTTGEDRLFHRCDNYIDDFLLSPAGDKLYVQAGRIIEAIDIPSGREIGRSPSLLASMLNRGITPNGEYLLVLTVDNILVSVSTKTLLPTDSSNAPIPIGNYVDLAISDSLIVIPTADGCVAYNWRTNVAASTSPIRGAVSGETFSKDATKYYLCDFYGLRVVDTRTGKVLDSSSSGREARTLHTNPAERYLLCSGINILAEVFDLRSLTTLDTIGSVANSTEVSHSPDGTLTCVQDEYNCIVYRNADITPVLRFSVRQILTAAISADNRVLLTGSRDGRVETWDIASGKQILKDSFPFLRITRVSFSRDGSECYAFADSNALTISIVLTLRAADLQVLRAVPCPRTHPLYSEPSSDSVISSTGLWDMVEDKLVPLTITSSPIGFSPDLRSYFAGDSWQLKRYDAVTGDTLTRYDSVWTSAPIAPILRLAVSRDQRYVVGVYLHYGLSIWDYSSGRLLATYDGTPTGLYNIYSVGENRFVLTSGLPSPGSSGEPAVVFIELQPDRLHVEQDRYTQRTGLSIVHHGQGNESLTFQLVTQEAGTVTLRIIDILGRDVAQLFSGALPENSVKSFNSPRLRRGVYRIVAANPQGTVVSQQFIAE